MINRTLFALLLIGCSLLYQILTAAAQTQTTGRVAGTVNDQRGALIVGAEVTVTNELTGEERKVLTDPTGSYAVPLLTPSSYKVRVTAKGFNTAVVTAVRVAITETTSINLDLSVQGIIVDPVVIGSTPLVQADGPQLGRVVEARTVSE